MEGAVEGKILEHEIINFLEGVEGFFGHVRHFDIGVLNKFLVFELFAAHFLDGIENQLDLISEALADIEQGNRIFLVIVIAEIEFGEVANLSENAHGVRVFELKRNINVGRDFHNVLRVWSCFSINECRSVIVKCMGRDRCRTG
jgi:hypothetical protein